jgi:hypothetical protein
MTGLNHFQQNTVNAARAALDEKAHEYDPESMAGRIGRLQWHLAEVLALVDELAGEGRGPVDVRRGPGGGSS